MTSDQPYDNPSETNAPANTHAPSHPGIAPRGAAIVRRTNNPQPFPAKRAPPAARPSDAPSDGRPTRGAAIPALRTMTPPSPIQPGDPAMPHHPATAASARPAAPCVPPSHPLAHAPPLPPAAPPAAPSSFSRSRLARSSCSPPRDDAQHPAPPFSRLRRKGASAVPHAPHRVSPRPMSDEPPAHAPGAAATAPYYPAAAPRSLRMPSGALPGLTIPPQHGLHHAVRSTSPYHQRRPAYVHADAVYPPRDACQQQGALSGQAGMHAYYSGVPIQSGAAAAHQRGWGSDYSACYPATHDAFEVAAYAGQQPHVIEANAFANADIAHPLGQPDYTPQSQPQSQQHVAYSPARSGDTAGGMWPFGAQHEQHASNQLRASQPLDLQPLRSQPLVPLSYPEQSPPPAVPLVNLVTPPKPDSLREAASQLHHAFLAHRQTYDNQDGEPDLAFAQSQTQNGMADLVSSQDSVPTGAARAASEIVARTGERHLNSSTELPSSLDPADKSEGRNEVAEIWQGSMKKLSEELVDSACKSPPREPPENYRIPRKKTQIHSKSGTLDHGNGVPVPPALFSSPERKPRTKSAGSAVPDAVSGCRRSPRLAKRNASHLSPFRDVFGSNATTPTESPARPRKSLARNLKRGVSLVDGDCDVPLGGLLKCGEPPGKRRRGGTLPLPSKTASKNGDDVCATKPLRPSSSRSAGGKTKMAAKRATTKPRQQLFESDSEEEEPRRTDEIQSRRNGSQSISIKPERSTAKRGRAIRKTNATGGKRLAAKGSPAKSKVDSDAEDFASPGRASRACPKTFETETAVTDEEVGANVTSRYADSKNNCNSRGGRRKTAPRRAAARVNEEAARSTKALAKPNAKLFSDSDADLDSEAEFDSDFQAVRPRNLKRPRTRANSRPGRVEKSGVRQQTQLSPRRTRRAQMAARADHPENPNVESEDSQERTGVGSDDSGADGDDDKDGRSPASPMGSQPLVLKVKAMPERKKGRGKTYADYLFERISPEESSAIRIAFLKNYPQPPSNMQAQGRYEETYGCEMDNAMVRGLWKRELQPWSHRWWDLYQKFGDLMRVKKREKPKDKDPTLKAAEINAWAEEFYREHGDAKLQQNVQTATAEGNKQSAGA